MSRWTKPKGTVTRHPADWHDHNLFIGGYAFPYAGGAAVNLYVTISLFNRDTNGRLLKIWGYSVSSDGGGGWNIGFSSGPIGSNQTGATSIRPDLGAPQVDVNIQSTVWVSTNPTPYSVETLFGQAQSNGFDGAHVMSPYPLWIVPANQSIVALNTSASFTPSIFFWFEMSPV